jgi:hypothetical protein
MEDFFENSPKSNIFRKIYLWWRFDGRYYHNDLIRGIKKLWYWFPVIWKDRDYDDHFIFEVLKHKLKAQSKYIGENDRHTRAQLDAKRMKLCVSLIQKIQDEYYNMEYMGYCKDRVWFTDCEDRPGHSLYNSEVLSENFDEFFKKYPLVYKRVLGGEGPFSLKGRENDKKIIAMNICHINQQRAHKLLFKIMEQNILGWWD